MLSLVYFLGSAFRLFNIVPYSLRPAIDFVFYGFLLLTNPVATRETVGHCHSP